MNIRSNIDQTRSPLRADELRLVVISDAAPARNGVGAYYQDLAELLNSRVAQATVVSPTLNGGKWSASIVLPLPGDPTQKLCVPNPWTLQKQLKAFQPDVVIAATPGAYGLVGAFLASRMKIPVLAGFHTSFEHLTELYWQGTWHGKIIHQYFKFSNAYLFKKARQILANSSEMIVLAKELGAGSTALIGTPISASFVTPALEPYTGQFSKILFAGRLAVEKNIESIIRAAKDLPDFQFGIAGDGPLRHYVEEAAAAHENVHYFGWLNRDALREKIDEHHALLLPSHFESFGTIALEAMARERLTIVSADCGITQWSELRECLNVIKVNTSIEDKIRQIASFSNEQRCEIARRSRRHALLLNDKCIDHWCILLADTVSKFRQDIKNKR